MSLKQFSNKELKKELVKREEKAKKNAIPKQLPNIDWKPLLEQCADYIKYINSSFCEDNDFEHYIYEAVMKCVYGSKFWNWYNSIVDQ